MTKKDFIAIGSVLEELHPSSLRLEEDEARGAERQWARTVERLADLFQTKNPRFMRERWLDFVHGRCGPNGGSR